MIGGKPPKSKAPETDFFTELLDRETGNILEPFSVMRPVIAVGTGIAACPPHGSRRAQLTHRALTLSD